MSKRSVTHFDLFVSFLARCSASRQQITCRDFSCVFFFRYYLHSGETPTALKSASENWIPDSSDAAHSSRQIERGVPNIQYLLIRRPSSASVFRQHWLRVSADFLSATHFPASSSFTSTTRAFLSHHLGIHLCLLLLTSSLYAVGYMRFQSGHLQISSMFTCLLITVNLSQKVRFLRMKSNRNQPGTRKFW